MNTRVLLLNEEFVISSFLSGKMYSQIGIDVPKKASEKCVRPPIKQKQGTNKPCLMYRQSALGHQEMTNVAKSRYHF